MSSGTDGDRIEVSLRLPGYTFDGLVVTGQQLADRSYLIHALLDNLSSYLSAGGGGLQVSVNNGPWHLVSDREAGGVLLEIKGDETWVQWRPQLSRTEAALLPTEFADVHPDWVTHGAPLPEIIASQAPWRSWLEAAVRGGYIPHQEGIELAQRGEFLFTRAQVQECVDTDVLGDAEAWLSAADTYRAFARVLRDEATALDQWKADLFGGEA